MPLTPTEISRKDDHRYGVGVAPCVLMRDMNNTPGHESGSTKPTVQTFTDADRAVEYARMLRAVTTKVPAPRVRSVDGTDVIHDVPAGSSGGELLNRDTAAAILSACGRALAKIHRVDTTAAFENPSRPGVLVHGDFGPGRVRFRRRDLTVTGIVGWEHAHIGAAVEDLAWCEWSVRNAHPDCFDAVPHLYHGYGTDVPPWVTRQSVMLATCRRMGDLAARRKDGTATAWHRRAAITAAWRE